MPTMPSKEQLYKDHFIDLLPWCKIAQKYNVGENTIHRWKNLYELGTRIRTKEMVGLKLEKWTVLYQATEEEIAEHIKNRDRNAYWWCKCDCGVIKILPTNRIGKKCKSCGCSKYKGYEEISGSYWFGVQNRALKSGKTFNISIEYGWELFLKQDKKCFFSGVPLLFCPHLFNKLAKDIQTASLDRIDSSKGYEIDNVQWVHKNVNIMKNCLSNGDFVYLCHLIAENFQKPQSDRDMNKYFAHSTEKWDEFLDKPRYNSTFSQDIENPREFAKISS